MSDTNSSHPPVSRHLFDSGSRSGHRFTLLGPSRVLSGPCFVHLRHLFVLLRRRIVFLGPHHWNRRCEGRGAIFANGRSHSECPSSNSCYEEDAILLTTRFLLRFTRSDSTTQLGRIVGSKSSEMSPPSSTSNFINATNTIELSTSIFMSFAMTVDSPVTSSCHFSLPSTTPISWLMSAIIHAVQSISLS